MMRGADVVYFTVGAWAGVEEVAEVRWWFGWIDWVICEESGRPLGKLQGFEADEL